MAQVIQRYRQLIASGTETISLSPGYRYSLFVGPFDSGTVTLNFVGSGSVGQDFTVDAVGGDITTDGKVAELLAVTDTLVVDLDTATDVYVELNLVKSVANATDGYV